MWNQVVALFRTQASTPLSTPELQLPPPQSTPTADESSLRDLLKQQHQMAHDNIKQVLTSFMSWYTFFWTLNVVALGWLYASKEIQDPKAMLAHGRGYIYILFILLNLIAIRSCLESRLAALRLRHEAEQAAATWLSRLAPAHSLPAGRGLLPLHVTSYAFMSCAVSLLLNTLAWAVLLLTILR